MNEKLNKTILCNKSCFSDLLLMVDYSKEFLLSVINDYRNKLSSCVTLEEKELLIKKFNDFMNQLPIFPIESNEVISILLKENVNIFVISNYKNISNIKLSNELLVDRNLKLQIKSKNNNLVLSNLFNPFIKCDSNKYEYQCFDFIPYKKIGPFSLDKQTDDKEFMPSGVKFLYERTFNVVNNRPIWIDSPEHIRRGNLSKVYINCNNIKVKITCHAKDFVKNLEQITDDVVVNIENDSMDIYSSKLGISAGAINSGGNYYIQVLNFYGEEEFEQFLNKI